MGLYSGQSAKLELLLLVPPVRSVFSSASVKDVQLGCGSPPGGAGKFGAVTRVLRGGMHGLRDDSVTTCFPADCRVCGGPMTVWSMTPVCDACVGRVGAQAAALCGICGEGLGMESARFAAALGAVTCTMCRLAPPEFARAVAYAEYVDETREMLHLLKYDGMQRLASLPLGEWMADAILQIEDAAARELVVIGVPLFAARERVRGFNQSVLLADAALSRLRKLRPEWRLVARHEALRRVRDTDAQFSLQPRARRANLRGAFSVANRAALEGREVLLIDDIMTTGATARECASVLMRAGAAKVWVATVARAQPEVAVMAETGFVARWGEDATAGSQRF